MDYAVHLHGKINDLTKRYNLSPDQTLALQIEAGAICYILEAGHDYHRQFEDFSSSAPPELALMATLAKGALADLKCHGVDASNAKQYISDKLAALEEKLKSRSY